MMRSLCLLILASHVRSRLHIQANHAAAQHDPTRHWSRFPRRNTQANRSHSENATRETPSVSVGPRSHFTRARPLRIVCRRSTLLVSCGRIYRPWSCDATQSGGLTNGRFMAAVRGPTARPGQRTDEVSDCPAAHHGDVFRDSVGIERRQIRCRPLFLVLPHRSRPSLRFDQRRLGERREGGPALPSVSISFTSFSSSPPFICARRLSSPSFWRSCPT